MAENIEIKIKAIIESADASKNIDELKDSLKELESIAENVDLSPDQLNQLGGAMTDLSSKIQTSEANLENFDRGVKTVKASGDLLAGSIAAVVGGLATLGIENEYVTNLTQGAAGAIALSSGVAQAGDAIVQLSQNTKIATVAQRAFNIVANLNPYLLAATALLATGAAILAIASSLDDSTKAQEISNEATKRAIDLRREQIDLDEEFAKLVAKNTKDRLEAELNAANARLILLEEDAQRIVENASTIEDANEQINKVEDEKTKVRRQKVAIEQNLQRENIRLQLEEFEQREKLLVAQGASEQQLFNARVATLNKTIELFGAETDEGIRAARELAVVRAQFATDTATKRTEASSKATTKEIEDEEKLKEKIKQNEESISEFLRKSRIGRELDRKEGADREIAELELEFKEQIKLAGDNKDLKIQLEQEFITRKKEIEKNAADEKAITDAAIQKKEIDDERAKNQAIIDSTFEKNQAVIDSAAAVAGALDSIRQISLQNLDFEAQSISDSYQRQIDAAAGNAEEIARLEQAREEELAAIEAEKQRRELQSFQISQGLALATLVVDAQKTLSEVALDGAEAGSSIAAGTAKTAAAGFPQNIPLLIAYGAQAAAIIASVVKARQAAKQIASQAGGGGNLPSISTSGIGSIGGGGAAPTTFSPQQFFGLGQGAINPNGGGPQDTRVFVVESDITNTQNRVSVIEDRARIG